MSRDTEQRLRARAEQATFLTADQRPLPLPARRSRVTPLLMAATAVVLVLALAVTGTVLARQHPAQVDTLNTTP